MDPISLERNETIVLGTMNMIMHQEKHDIYSLYDLNFWFSRLFIRSYTWWSLSGIFSPYQIPHSVLCLHIKTNQTFAFKALNKFPWNY